MSEVISPMSLPDEARKKLASFNLNLCLTCGTCSGGCPVTGTDRLNGLDVRKAFGMLA